MPSYEPRDIRNFAIAGHSDTGKTSFVEMALSKTGMLNRVGTVEDGTTVCDSDAQEKERGISIDSAVVHMSYAGKELNVLDTPGYPEFLGQVVTALEAVESVVLTISAPAGIQFNTRRVWDMAKQAGLARVILVTKMDGENVNFSELLGQIQEHFGGDPDCEIAPVLLPVGEGSSFSGVVNLLSPSESAPDGAVGDVETMHATLVEGIVAADEEMMDRYLEEEQIAAEELAALFSKSVAEGAIVPVLCCAARADKGVDEVLDFLANVLPSPVDGLKRMGASPAAEGEEPTYDVALEPDPAAPFAARVFKSVTDAFVGKLCYFRVYSGALKGDLSFTLSSTGKNQRVAQLLRPQGSKQEPVQDCVTGDVVAVAKVEEIGLGDVLYDAKRPIALPPIPLPRPMASLAVEPKSRGDEQKIGSSLAKLCEEDPTFRMSRDPQTHEMVVTGMSTLHMDIMLARLKDRFQVEVNSKQPKIPYKETITAPSDAKYRHKKQTGGRGQFGEVWIRLIPVERGAGFEFVDKVVGGSIPNQFIPAVEKGVLATMAKGVIAGYPVEDVRLELYDGRHHAVDSSEAAFKIAGSRAFQEAFTSAKPVLLEPIVDIEVSVPGEFFGDISAHLTGHRARISGMDAVGSIQTIRAEVPMAEITNYATELKSMTGGQGSYSIEFARYDVVPANMAQPIIAKAKKPDEEEEE